MDDQPYIYSADDVRAVVDEAGKAGLRVCAHAMTEPGARTDIFAQPPNTSRGAFAVGYVDVYKEAGVPARDVLRMMATNAARLLGVEQRRGALRAGLAADIIATADYPLADPAALKKVVFVMKDGKIIRR